LIDRHWWLKVKQFLRQQASNGRKTHSNISQIYLGTSIADIILSKIQMAFYLKKHKGGKKA